MLRVLFVDDEPNILDGLRRMLRSRRSQWEMLFTGSAQEALEWTRALPVDVIVTDTHLLDMSGAELLRTIQSESPDTVRFVLSGVAELESAMRMIPVAHQFLAKPCNPDLLAEAIERACRLRALLADARLRRLVGEIHNLPSCPATYTEITRAIADPDVEIDAVTAIVESDPMMAAKLLQIVNSAFFGLPRRIDSIADAVAYLGLGTIRDLVLSAEVFRPPAGASARLEALLHDLQTLALQTGGLARRIAAALDLERRTQDLCFLSGILHELGGVVLAAYMPEAYAGMRQRAREEARPIHELELQELGTTHAEVGAYLLGLWGLPYPVIEAAAFHHQPSQVPESRWGELGIVHVASALVEAKALESSKPRLDVAYLESRGAIERMDEWNSIAEQVLEEPASPDDMR